MANPFYQDENIVRQAMEQSRLITPEEMREAQIRYVYMLQNVAPQFPDVIDAEFYVIEDKDGPGRTHQT